MTAGRRCDGCPHVFHRDGCRAKGPSGCVPVADPRTGQPIGISCYQGKGPCLCPFGACHTCGAPIAGASTFPLYDGSPEIDIDRGSAAAPDGLLAVWRLADGSLACRHLAPGEQPGEGRWRGRAHVHQLTEVKETADADRA